MMTMAAVVLGVLFSTEVVNAGAISNNTPIISFPAPNRRVVSGSGNVFLGYNESVVRVEMHVWKLDGSTEVVQLTTKNAGAWSGSYGWFTGNSQTNTVRAVKARLIYKDRFGQQKTYDSEWEYPKY